MERLVLLVVLAVVAAVVAWLLQRRRPDPPSVPSYRAPSQVDRSDFAKPHEPILVAVFTSRTCSTCPEVWSDVQALAGPGRVIQEIVVQHDHGGDLHLRYKIDGVPTTLVAGSDGVIHAAFFGPLNPDQLREAVAELEAKT